MKSSPASATLDRIVGTWDVTGSHPLLPGRTLRGRVTFEYIEGGAFLRMHSKPDDPEIPEGVSIFGRDGDHDTCTMLYFDTRGVARTYDVTLNEEGLAWSRDAPEFAQRFRLTITNDGRGMVGEGTIKKDGATWEPDLSLSCVRATK